MIMDQEAVRALALMGRVMAEEIPVQDLTVIQADITVKIIRTTRVVTTRSSNSQVTRATQSN